MSPTRKRILFVILSRLFLHLKTVCCLLWMKAYESTEMLSSVKWGKSILKKGTILWNWRRYHTRHFLDTKMTWKTFARQRRRWRGQRPRLWWWWKPSRRRLWRNATSHYIRENCHPPKSSGPLVHFSRLLVNACLTDNEWLIMSFLLGCYSYGKAQSDS